MTQAQALEMIQEFRTKGPEKMALPNAVEADLVEAEADIKVNEGPAWNDKTLKVMWAVESALEIIDMIDSFKKGCGKCEGCLREQYGPNYVHNSSTVLN